MSNQPTQAPTPNANRNKRRRAVEDAATTLRKPFRSPLITRPGPGTGPGPSPSSAGPATPARRPSGLPVGTPSRLSFSTLRGARHTSATASATASTSAGRRLTHATTGVSRSGAAFHVASASASRSQTGPDLRIPPEETPETETQKDTEDWPGDLPLSNRMRLLRERTSKVVEAVERQVEAARQREEELRRVEGLTEKWKGAGRTAAEELFGVARRRVKERGGLRGLERERREAVRRTREFFQEMGGFGDGRRGGDEDAEGEGGGEGEGYDVGEREEEGKDEDGGLEDDEQEYTMAMMLKDLGLDPDILGYDPVEDTWKD